MAVMGIYAKCAASADTAGVGVLLVSVATAAVLFALGEREAGITVVLATSEMVELGSTDAVGIAELAKSEPRPRPNPPLGDFVAIVTSPLSPIRAPSWLVYLYFR
jgi:hypothetical protein